MRLTFWAAFLAITLVFLLTGIVQAQYEGRRPPPAKTSEDVPKLSGDDDFGGGAKKARGETEHENHPPTLSVRWDPPQPKLGKTVLNPNGRPSVMVIYAEGKDPDHDELTYTFKSLDTGQVLGPSEQNWICMWPGEVTYGLFREEITVSDEHGAKTSVVLSFMVMSESFDDDKYKNINTVSVEGTQGLSMPSQFYCPSPIFGKLLWSGNTPRCLEGFTLMQGSLFRQVKDELVCVKCPPTCTFVEDRDRKLICVVAGSGRWEGAPASPAGTARNREQQQRQQMTGNWKWFNGSGVTMHPNGTFSVDTGQKGTWRIADPQKRKVKMDWAKDLKGGGPWYDDLTLSEDGRSLEGYNQIRTRVTGTKVDGYSCKDLSGNWTHRTQHGACGQSTWVLKRIGQTGHSYEVWEQGCGNVQKGKAKATFTGSQLRIDFDHSANCKGYYYWNLDSSCTRGTGELVCTTTIAPCKGKGRSEVERK